MPKELDRLTADQILRLAAGRLNAREQARLAAALSGDAELRRAAREQHAVWQALDDWDAEPVSAGFDARLYAKLRALEAPTWRSRVAALVRAERWTAALPFGLAMLVLATGLLVSHSRKVPVTASPVPAVSTPEADLIESTLDDLQTLHQLYADGAPPSQL